MEIPACGAQRSLLGLWTVVTGALKAPRGQPTAHYELTLGYLGSSPKSRWWCGATFTCWVPAPVSHKENGDN